MRLDFVFHEEQITAESPPVEWPVLAETNMENGLRSRYGVFDIFKLSYSGVSVIAMSRMRDRISLIWVVLARLGGLRTETWEEWTLCALAMGTA